MGAAVSLHTALHWLRVASGHWLGKRTAARLSHAALALTLSLFALLSLSRSTALVKYYGAPMHIYSYLPEVISCELLLAREGGQTLSQFAPTSRQCWSRGTNCLRSAWQMPAVREKHSRHLLESPCNLASQQSQQILYPLTSYICPGSFCRLFRTPPKPIAS